MARYPGGCWRLLATPIISDMFNAGLVQNYHFFPNSEALFLSERLFHDGTVLITMRRAISRKRPPCAWVARIVHEERVERCPRFVIFFALSSLIFWTSFSLRLSSQTCLLRCPHIVEEARITASRLLGRAFGASLRLTNSLVRHALILSEQMRLTKLITNCHRRHRPARRRCWQVAPGGAARVQSPTTVRVGWRRGNVRSAGLSHILAWHSAPASCRQRTRLC